LIAVAFELMEPTPELALTQDDPAPNESTDEEYEGAE
jgi:hypothetical protein